mmetsp:Transcript_97195/g.271357  ORF Transcript_97195/g.271357 Transcript_97195/m.271357 type:complete len:161 (-) Transcript_97195:291-773(-)
MAAPTTRSAVLLQNRREDDGRQNGRAMWRPTGAGTAVEARPERERERESESEDLNADRPPVPSDARPCARGPLAWQPLAPGRRARGKRLSAQRAWRHSSKQGRNSHAEPAARAPRPRPAHMAAAQRSSVFKRSSVPYRVTEPARKEMPAHRIGRFAGAIQ